MTVYRLKFHFVLHKLEMLQTIDMGQYRWARLNFLKKEGQCLHLEIEDQ